MNQVFDYIEEVEYILLQLFESGFSCHKNIINELKECQNKAIEFGMGGCNELFEKFIGDLHLLIMNQIEFKQLLKGYCNLVSYFNITKDLVIAKTISRKV